LPTPGGPNKIIEGRKSIFSLFIKEPSIPAATSSCPIKSSKAENKKTVY
jgi:hypothetical protein